MKNDKEWGLPRSLTLRASFAEAESDGPFELLTAAAVNRFLNMAVKCKKIMRYRDAMEKKDKTRSE